MAFAPVKPGRKRSLRFAPRPDFKDFSGPRDGDYVRYVEDLMRWSEQEQERLRLQALGDKTRTIQDETQWGRTSAKPAGMQTSMQPGESLNATVEGLKRKAVQHLTKLQQQAQKAQQAQQATRVSNAGGTPSTTKKQNQNASASVIFVVIGFVLAGIFAPSLIPWVIVVWVVFNIVRAVQKASRNNKP